MKTYQLLSLIAVSSFLFAGPANAGLLCDGQYQNGAGVVLKIEKSGAVTMTFNGNTEACTGEMAEGSKMKLTCKNGLNSTGDFANDCSSLTFNNDTYKRK